MSLIQDLKEFFSKREEKFMDYKTDKGILIRVKELKEGEDAGIIAEDGTVSAASAGDYILEDGTKISIDDKGKIVKIEASETEKKEIVEAENTEVAAATDAPAAEGEKPVAASDLERITALEAQVQELSAAVMMIAEQCKSMMDNSSYEEVVAELKKENRSLKKEVKELSEQPAVEKASFKKVETGENQPIGTFKTKEFRYFEKKKISPAFIQELKEQLEKK